MKKNQIPDKINILGEFSDPLFEKAFQESSSNSAFTIAKYSILSIGVIFSLLVIYDYFYFADKIDFLYSLLVRMFVSFICLIAFFSVDSDRLKSYNGKRIILSTAELTLFFGYLFMLSQQNAQGFLEQSMATMLMIMAIFSIPNRWIYSFCSSIIVVTFFFILTPLYILTIDPFTRTESFTYLLLCTIFSAAFMHNRSVTQRKEYLNTLKLEYLSSTDGLTGIYNRARFEVLLQEEIEKVNEGRTSTFSLMLFDLDDFKYINDEHGHGGGDLILKEISAAVISKIRENDIFARWGGDEFVLLFPNIGIEQSHDMAERIHKACTDNTFTNSPDITISVGITVYRKGESDSALIKRADDMMYEAKRAGKNRFMSDLSVKNSPGSELLHQPMIMYDELEFDIIYE